MGSTQRAYRLCKVFGETKLPKKARTTYYKDWRREMLNVFVIVSSRTIMIQDLDKKTMSFTFTLTTDDAPLAVGLGVQKVSSQRFAAANLSVTFNYL